MLKKILKLLFVTVVGITTANAQTWTEQGTAPAATTKIEVGSNGVVYYLTSSTTDNIYFSSRFAVASAMKLPGLGAVTDITANSTRVFGLDKNNTIYEFNGSSWAVFTTGKLTDATIDENGLYGCNSTITNNVYALSLTGTTWGTVAGLGTLTKIDRADDQTMVGYNSGGSYYFNNTNQTWPSMLNTPAGISAISTSGLNNTWCLANGVPYKYNASTNSWVAQSGTGIVSIATFGTDEVWVLKNDGKVYANKTLSDQSATYSTYFAEAPASSNQIEVATNGDLYFLTSASQGNIFRMDTKSKVNSLFGASNNYLSDIAAYGQVFGIGLQSTSGNNVFKYATTSWVSNHVAGSLADLDINNATLFGVNSAGSIYSLDISSVTSNWVNIGLPAGASKIVKVAITSEGVFVAVDNQNKTYVLLGGIWNTVNNTISISSITALDVQNIWSIGNGDIYKYNTSTNNWDLKFVASGVFKSISMGKQNELFALDLTNKVYKIDLTVTALQENEENLNSSFVYPNPTKDFINVSEFSQVYDLMGNKLAEGAGKIDVSEFANGVYILKNTRGQFKIVKQ